MSTPPPVPVLERIVRQIVARVSTVTKANGYQTEQRGVSRQRLIESMPDPSDHEILVTQDPEVEDEENSTEGNPRLRAYTVDVHVLIFIAPSNLDPTTVDTYINFFAADVMKALTAPDNWQQFADAAGEGEDHVATNSRIAAPLAIDNASGSLAGKVITYTVEYRHPENDPYTVG